MAPNQSPPVTFRVVDPRDDSLIYSGPVPAGGLTPASVLATSVPSSETTAWQRMAELREANVFPKVQLAVSTSNDATEVFDEDLIEALADPATVQVPSGPDGACTRQAARL